MTDDRLLKDVMLQALDVGCKVRWVKGIRCQGCEWVDNERSKTGVEGHSMEGSERGMDRKQLGSGQSWK